MKVCVKFWSFRWKFGAWSGEFGYYSKLCFW